MKLVHLDRIAQPWNHATRGLDANTGQCSDGPARPVIPGNPFGKDKSDLSATYRNAQLCVIDISRGIGQIDVKRDRLSFSQRRDKAERAHKKR